MKLKEYAGAGAPWLASPIGPYAGLGEEQAAGSSPTTAGSRRSTT